MSETLPHYDTVETNPGLALDVEIIREAENYIRTTIGATKYDVHPQLKTERAIDESMSQVLTGELPMTIMGGWALEREAHVRLRSDYVDGADDEALEKYAGFIDEDSFDFVWQLLDHVAEVEASGPAIEDRAEAMLAQYKHFLQSEGGYERIANDPRLAGLLRLNAAVEFAQVRDFESALTELEAIPEERLRKRLMNMLAEIVEQVVTPVSAEESEANLLRNANYVHGYNIPSVGAEIDTRIVSNRSINTFKRMFDPFSDGRIYPSVYPYHERGGRSTRPSTGDHHLRQGNERKLGHPRRLFSPRVVYGSVLETEHINDGSDPAWQFGGARFVLRPECRAAEESTFAFGDTLNGTPFNMNRALLRPDADRGSKVLSERYKNSTRELGHGSISHYIEAQFDGLHMTDIEAVVLRPEALKSEETDELIMAAETAALQGIEVTYIFNWEVIKTANGRGRRGVAEEKFVSSMTKRLTEIKKMCPHVQLKIETRDEADPALFASLDSEVATIVDLSLAA